MTVEEYFNNGMSKFGQQDFKGAIADFTNAIESNFTNAIEVNPNDTDENKFVKKYIEDTVKIINKGRSYVFRGLAKCKMQNYHGANEDCIKAIQISATDEVVHYNCGHVKIYQQDYKGAIADFTNAIRINHKYAEAFNDRGIIKNRNDDVAGALNDFNKAIEINPNYSGAYYNRGNAKSKVNDYDG
ncbi:MAG TPA: tetratricopeptide repeat protein, partial [Chitinophagaceae bacterium]|nr:tetratricopeptide repeat protein [Chitinophagaceae bacterium]